MTVLTVVRDGPDGVVGTPVDCSASLARALAVDRAVRRFPCWWLLGVADVLPILMALFRCWSSCVGSVGWCRRASPSGCSSWPGWRWGAVLTADAPGAVPGGGLSRLLVFGYRAGWYAACTIVLVWLGNADARKVSLHRVTQLLGYMFVVTAVGGLLGVLTPTLELRSLVELVLPGSLRANSFVTSIVHPSVADIQSVLGRPEARPKAPFAFANSWGSNLSLYLPFFLIGWWRNGRRWQRLLVPAVLTIAAIPVIYSLNRGLWLSLAVGAGGLVLVQLRRGRPKLFVGTVLALVVVAILLAVSPLGTVLQERMDHQHSNGRRSQLLQQTVRSAALGSPVVGFGTTRDVQGSFASIAGAATPDCKACGVPPLGTQGHLWLVIFSQGLLGAALFLAFFARAAAMAWPGRTQAQLLCGFVLTFVLQLPVYDTLGLPMYTVMVAIALAWREHVADRRALRRPTFEQLGGSLRRAAPVLIVVSALAAGAGVAISSSPAAVVRRAGLDPAGALTGLAGLRCVPDR